MPSEDGVLNGQVGIVTGAGRGIGRAIALSLAASGMHVVATARSRAEIEGTAALVNDAGNSARAIVVDVRERASIEACVVEVLRVHGRLDLLVNNAGSNAALGPVWEADPDLWLQDLEVNLYAPFLFCRSALPSMIARRQGRIINLLGGGVTGPIPYDTGYSSSKAGVARFTETLSIEARPWGVKVFALGPGAVKTAMTDHVFESAEGLRWNSALKARMQGRWVGPDSAAKLATIFASGRADALAGRLVTVTDDLETLLGNADAIRDNDLHTLRVVKSMTGHVPAVLLTALEEEQS